MRCNVMRRRAASCRAAVQRHAVLGVQRSAGQRGAIQGPAERCGAGAGGGDGGQRRAGRGGADV